MIVIDSHLHSKFSFDSRAESEDMVRSAIRKGIQTLCFTEHLDIDKSNAHANFAYLFSRYFKELTRLREKYRGQIDIIIGLEAGWNEYADIIAKVTAEFPFEYIINSIHVHYGIDYFGDETYLKRTKYDFFEEYLDLVYQSLSAPYRFDTIGHLGYPSRVVEYSDNAWHYSEHSVAIDKLLKKIIEKEIIIEVNTSVYKSVHPFLPSEEILSRYHQLGGRLITYSSDAHNPESLGRNYPETIKKLKELGFCHLTKSKNGKKELLPI